MENKEPEQYKTSLIVPFETGLPEKLRDVGFDEYCEYFYHIQDQDTRSCHGSGFSPINNSYEKWVAGCNKRDVEKVCLPLYQQVVTWFFEKHKMYIWLVPTSRWKFTVHFRYEDKNGYHLTHVLKNSDDIINFDNENEAYNAAFEKAIETIEYIKQINHDNTTR